MVAAEQSRDAFFNGRLQLAQFQHGHHRGGTDGVLAAMAAAAMAAAQASRLRRSVAALDMGAGSGLIGLGLAAAIADTHVTLVERDPDLAGLCVDNIQRNDLTARVRALAIDVLARQETLSAQSLVPESQDLVVTNPPWFGADSVRPASGAGKRDAHVFRDDDADGMEDPLQAWLRCACRLLRPGGELLVIHRTEALPDLLTGMARRFGDIRVAPVAARRGQPANRVMVRGMRGRRGPLVLDAPLTLHRADGSFTEIAARAHGGEPLTWGSWGQDMA